MNKETYPIKSDVLHLNHEFLSVGPNGSIKKAVRFKRQAGNLFNLAFGELDDTNGKIDDFARSNNNDREKVLATVASAVLDFFDYYPEAMIYAKGRTPARTRLFQIGINANWHLICKRLQIEGWNNGEWELFKKEKNYQAFLAIAKK